MEGQYLHPLVDIAGGTEEEGEAGGKNELDGAEGAGRTMCDQGEAVGAKSGRSQGRDDGSTGRGGAMDTEAGGEARGSSGLGEAGGLKLRGSSSQTGVG